MDGPYTQDRALEDIPGAAHALDLFLASHMVESEQFCHESDPTKERLYFASGYGLVQFVKGLMSYEDEDLLAAIGHTKHGNVIAQQHRKKHASLARRMAGLVVGSDSISGVGFIKSMTPVERHAELIYAETLFEKALLGIVYSGDWLAFIKEALNLRSTVNTYRALGKYLDAMDAAAVSRGEGPIDTSIDPHFRSGVYLGVGATNMILSLMPSRLLSIVELFGFKGDRMHGLELLMKAGGWTEDSDEPGIGAAEEGVRRSICDMALLIFHLVLSSFTVTGVSIPTASKILAYNLRRYPRGVFFLFGQGRLHLLRGQPSLAIASYQKAISIQSQYRNLHHISFWEMAIANFALWEVRESLESWRELEREATWSRAVYAYGIAVCLLQLGGEERREEAAGFLEKVPGLLQRIAGKSIPMEKFVARKSRKFKKQHNRLALPALEFGYFFLAIKNAPRPVIIGKMLPVIASLQSTLSQHAEAPEGYEGGHGGYWDDLCLASFLEGVCLRYVAHPDPDAIVDPSEKLSISQADAETTALAAFQRVLDNGPKIDLDHHLVYHTHYELGRLLACMGKVDDGRKHLDLVLSGKSLEVNSSTRKGKYSMEGALLMRTNAAVEALEHHRGV
ncbi:hypothetical protein BD410DRAFT_815806 [Rickenella mellea]|uniref:Tetratricopeptide repeat protein 39B n=1 Tax=Rickenella mellea TaxID=50990 RepID=A0A4Y7PYU3_9AGAM|nr:hypothetical protein BD410DRAFT_815806 [Rickenella mellea]